MLDNQDVEEIIRLNRAGTDKAAQDHANMCLDRKEVRRLINAAGEHLDAVKSGVFQNRLPAVYRGLTLRALNRFAGRQLIIEIDSFRKRRGD